MLFFATCAMQGLLFEEYENKTKAFIYHSLAVCEYTISVCLYNITRNK